MINSVHTFVLSDSLSDSTHIQSLATSGSSRYITIITAAIVTVGFRTGDYEWIYKEKLVNIKEQTE